MGKMPAPPAQRACLRAELAQDGEVAQGPEGHVKAWPSPNTYKSEAHASQVSHSSVYFGDSCRASQDRGRQVWSCPQGERVSDQGPHTRSQGWSPGSLSPRQHPSGVDWPLAALFQQGSAGQGGAATHPGTAADAERQGPVGGAPRGGSGAHGTTGEGLAAAPLPKVALRGALKFLMKLCKGKGRICHPRTRRRVAAAAQGAGPESVRQETWRSLLQRLQLRWQVAPRVDAVGDAVL